MYEAERLNPDLPRYQKRISSTPFTLIIPVRDVRAHRSCMN